MEYGSDFHLIEEFLSGKENLTDVFPDAVFLADGRQCLVTLIRQECWRRIWLPEYFCYEVIDSMKAMTDIEIMYYLDYPSFIESETVYSLPFQKGDVILRMNYYGMRDFRSNKNIPIPVIEDHSHDILSHWALNSDADWCIASLRKTIPIPEGGIIWSPKGYILPTQLLNSHDNQILAANRWRAMEIKAEYLAGKKVDKNSFRKIFTKTEELFDFLDVSSIDNRSMDYIYNFNIIKWKEAKKRNWSILKSLFNLAYEVLAPEKDF